MITNTFTVRVNHKAEFDNKEDAEAYAKRVGYKCTVRETWGGVEVGDRVFVNQDETGTVTATLSPVQNGNQRVRVEFDNKDHPHRIWEGSVVYLQSLE